MGNHHLTNTSIQLTRVSSICELDFVRPHFEVVPLELRAMIDHRASYRDVDGGRKVAFELAHVLDPTNASFDCYEVLFFGRLYLSL